MAKYRIYTDGDLFVKELARGERYSIRVRFPPDETHPRWWYSPYRRVLCASKAEAMAACMAYKDELQRSRRTGFDVDATLGEYARAWYESRRVQGKVSALTLERDDAEVRRIERYMGALTLRTLTSDELVCAYDQMAADGISQPTRAKVHSVVKRVLKRAVAAQILPVNVAESIEGMSRPKVSAEKRDEQRVDESDLARLFAELGAEEPDGQRVALWLGAATGMRRGEVLALTWADIDLDGGIINVRWQMGKERTRKAAKTDRSARRVAICATENVATDPTIAYLKGWQKAQRAVFRRFNAKQVSESKNGVSWSENAPVCSNARCTWLGVDNFGRWRRGWYVAHGFAYYESEEQYRDAAGVLRTRHRGYHGPNFHSLRHTQATLLIGGGADVKSVQDRLGHAQASTTLNIYAEAMRSRERQTADMMSKLISGAQSGEG